MGAFYQSVLFPVVWKASGGSRFLEELRAWCRDETLSIKFNVDGFDPSTTLGRVVGTIGPASSSEPRRFIRGRQLLPQIGPTTLGPGPADGVNFAHAVVDSDTRRLLVDLGNALPTLEPGGALAPIGALNVGYLDTSDVFHALDQLAEDEYATVGWYESTGGIRGVPIHRPLTSLELGALAENRVAVQVGDTLTLRENDDGLHLRADDFVVRLNPAERATITLWASRYGATLPHAAIVLFADTSGLQFDSTNYPAFLQVGTPTTGLEFPKGALTDHDGRAVVELTGQDPGNPRVYLDGQIYGIRYLLESVAQRVGMPPTTPFGYDPWDFVSVRVWDAYPAPAHPSWYEHVQPILEPYSRLYPVMGKIVNLNDYVDVAEHARILMFAFERAEEDPNHMPVTRDLSQAKRRTVIRFLKELDSSSKPLLGTPPPEGARPAPFTMPRRSAPNPAAAIGSKTLALSKRGSTKTHK